MQVHPDGHESFELSELRKELERELLSLSGKKTNRRNNILTIAFCGVSGVCSLFMTQIIGQLNEIFGANMDPEPLTLSETLAVIGYNALYCALSINSYMHDRDLIRYKETICEELRGRIQNFNAQSTQNGIPSVSIQNNPNLNHFRLNINNNSVGMVLRKNQASQTDGECVMINTMNLDSNVLRSQSLLSSQALSAIREDRSNELSSDSNSPRLNTTSALDNTTQISQMVRK